VTPTKARISQVTAVLIRELGSPLLKYEVVRPVGKKLQLDTKSSVLTATKSIISGEIQMFYIQGDGAKTALYFV
jgi:hypothetical protein